MNKFMEFCLMKNNTLKKTKLIFATVIYLILLYMAFLKPQSTLISDSLMVGSTLFYGLYSMSILINNQNITKNN